MWRVKEDDGKVYRYIDPNNKDSWWNDAKRRRAEEKTGQESIPHHKWGSLWLLDTAIREFTAEKEGRLEEWRFKELNHRAEEDAKVWEYNRTFGYHWIGPKDRKTE